MVTLRRSLAAALSLYTVVVVVVLASRLWELGSTTDDFFFLPAIGGVAIGVYLTLKVPDNRMGPLMAVMAAALVTLGISNVLVPWALNEGNLPLAVIVVQMSDLGWITQFVTALILLPLWFPTGEALNLRWAWIGRAAIVMGAITFLSFLFSGTVCAWTISESETCVNLVNPWGIEGFAGFETLFLVTMALALPAVASTFVRWRRSNDMERQQMKWFFIAAVGLLLAFLITFIDFGRLINDAAFSIGLTGIWAAVAVAVQKYRLYDIDRIISRTVSYAVIIAILAAIYVGLVTAVSSRLESSFAVAASTLAVAALFNPLRRRVHSLVDRRFNRSTYDTEKVMHAFAVSLRDEIDVDEVIDGWIDVVEETMEPASVGLWVRE